MPILARPDVLGCLLLRLRSFSEVTALVNSAAGWTDGRVGSPRISAVVSGMWVMPTRAVRLMKTGGPPGDIQTNVLRQRVDVTCYGSTDREASDLLNMVAVALAPDQSVRSSFTLGGCRVYDVVPEAAAIVDVDPQTTWPFAWQSFVVTWSGVPA
jgi:hypothetical protein